MALPEDLRRVVELDFEGYSNDELASRLDVSLATVKRRLKQSVRLLALSMGYCPDKCGVPVDSSGTRCDGCSGVWTSEEREDASRIAREVARR
jgi:hypothetical protein